MGLNVGLGLNVGPEYRTTRLEVIHLGLNVGPELALKPSILGSRSSGASRSGKFSSIDLSTRAIVVVPLLPSVIALKRPNAGPARANARSNPNVAA